MKKQLLASVGLTALMAAAGSAQAADMPLLKAPAPTVWSWSGLYIGGHAGYGWGRDPQSDDVFSGKAPPIGEITSQGGVWGFQAGANWQSGSWVGGLEIDLSGTSIKGSSSGSAGPVAFFVSESATLTDKFDLLGSARARLGFLPLPGLMIYGTAGPAWTRFVRTEDESFVESGGGGNTLTASETFSSPSWRFGLAAGAGVEARLGDSNWLGRVEYLHYDFGDSGSSFGVTSGVLTADVVRAGLSYKFTQARPGSGYATGMPVKAAPVAPWTWSGFYIGAHIGYGWGRDPTDDSDFGTISSNGVIGGLQAGANWQSGAFVGGLEIDASASSIKGSVSDSDGDTETDRFDWLSSARARLGYLVLPGTLIYGTGGTAWTRLAQTFNEDKTPFWEFGWVAGAGVETRLGATNWLGRIEYLHYDFGDSGSSSDVGSGHLTADVVRGGVSYKLDWSGAGPARVLMPLKAPPAAAASSWDGFYLGGHLGYGWGRDPHSDALFGFKLGSEVPQTDISGQGFVAGFQAGANWQMGSFVAGLETDLSATGIKGSATNSDTSTTETRTDKFDSLGSARARLGYLALPNVLLYGTGGAAWTRLNQTDTFSDGSGSSTPSWRFGWVAGVGGETRLWTSDWLLRLEYLHYDFGDSGSSSETFVGTGLAAPDTGSSNLTSGHLTADVVRTGLSYKFR
ncbi:MAG TPA: outer membrane beta-barrel protein [Xanthobacteraceae bacterium]|nr:outer membrane beta-barrel protein [Xanthobacteraceae bacterium]